MQFILSKNIECLQITTQFVGNEITSYPPKSESLWGRRWVKRVRLKRFHPGGRLKFDSFKKINDLETHFAFCFVSPLQGCPPPIWWILACSCRSPSSLNWRPQTPHENPPSPRDSLQLYMKLHVFVYMFSYSFRCHRPSEQPMTRCLYEISDQMTSIQYHTTSPTGTNPWWWDRDSFTHP